MSEVQVEQGNPQGGESQKLTKVVNLSQAIHVLVEAANIGKDKGIYSWGDLGLVGQAIELVATLQKDANDAEKENQTEELQPVKD
tara:strand:- start:5823 stop:6077 length:255 start_codon:yes stop_codon:yes gene_type:complete